MKSPKLESIGCEQRAKVCPKALGAILKARREMLGVSINRIAACIDSTLPVVASVESGEFINQKRRKWVLCLNAWCAALSCDPADVLRLATVPYRKES